MAVHAELEQLEGLKRRLTIKVSEEQFKNTYSKKLQEVIKNIKLPGFRAGKVPAHVVEQRHGTDLVNEVAGELIDSSFREALAEHDLSPAAQPQIDAGTQFAKDKPIEYSATFEILPEITLVDLTDTPIEKVVVEVSDEDEKQAIDRLLKQHATWTDVDRAVANGDQLVFDFAGTINGTAFDGGTSEGFTLEIGSNQMIPGFEEPLVGMSAGEEKDITVTFPETYGVKDLAGKEAVFHIKAHQVKEAACPELNDEFASSLGIESLDKLKEQVRLMVGNEANTRVQNALYQRVADALLEKNTVEVPAVLIDAEVAHLQQSARQQMASQQGKKDIEGIDLPRDPYVEDATKRVSLGLLLAEVIKVNSIKLDQAKLQQRVMEMFSNHPNPQEILEYYQKNKQMQSEMESQVLEQQAIECLLEKANITEVTQSCAEVMASLKD